MAHIQDALYLSTVQSVIETNEIARIERQIREEKAAGSVYTNAVRQQSLRFTPRCDANSCVGKTEN